MSKKFEESLQFKPGQYSVMTDTGWQEMVAIHETIKYKVWTIQTHSFELKCADDHIVFDEEYNEVFVKDLVEGQQIQTEAGLEEVTFIFRSQRSENMYDLELNENSDRRYWTDGILSHNTSLSKVLSKGRPILYINASTEGKIDIVREKIMNFCMTRSLSHLDADYKVVFMEEFNGASLAFYEALLATMEKFHESVRFIATTNYINKIPPAVLSRFCQIPFDPVDTEEELEMLKLYEKRVKLISKKLDMKWGKGVLSEFVSRNFPDLRKTFSLLQNFHRSGSEKIEMEDVKRASYSFIDLFEMLVAEPDPLKNYKVLLGEYAGKEDDIFVALSQEFPLWLVENYPEKEQYLGMIIIKVPEWEFMSKSLIEPCAGLRACFFALQTLLNS